MSANAATPESMHPALLQSAVSYRHQVVNEIRKVYVGSEDVIEMLLVALLTRGHVLLEGVPGIAKTTLAKAFAESLGCHFKRIQFTPDLLPADITGTYILNLQSNKFELREGPIFANIVLGDEINRAPAKTQSALLEAMAENQVTIDGSTRPLAPPFMVLATQNPIEQEGVYELPEAQIDRFLIKVNLGYPTPADEKNMLRTYNHPPERVLPILNPEVILKLASAAEGIHIKEELMDFIIRLTNYTRSHPLVTIGASPRASLALMRAAKARALLLGRDYVLPDDIKHLCPYVLTHRVMLVPEAEFEGTNATQVVERALADVKYNRN